MAEMYIDDVQIWCVCVCVCILPKNGMERSSMPRRMKMMRENRNEHRVTTEIILYDSN